MELSHGCTEAFLGSAQPESGPLLVHEGLADRLDEGGIQRHDP